MEALRDRDTDGRWRVDVLAEEDRARRTTGCALTSFFAGRDPDDLTLGDPDVPRDGVRAATRRPGHARSTATARVVTHRAAATYRVRRAGARHRLVRRSCRRCPARDLPGCFVYRTIDDLELRASGVRAAAEATGRGAVVGGGLLGLEAAGALRLLGLATDVVEFAPRLMPLQVDEGGGAMLRRLIEELGVSVRTRRRDLAGSRRPDGRRAPDGLRRRRRCSTPTWSCSPPACGPATSWPATPACRSASAAACVVDDGLPHRRRAVCAIGEVAGIDGRCLRPGRARATRWPRSSPTGCSAARRPSPAPTPPPSSSCSASTWPAFGDALGATHGALDVVYADPATGVYAKLVLSDDAQTLLGGVLVGDAVGLRRRCGRWSAGPLPARPLALLAPERRRRRPPDAARRRPGLLVQQRHRGRDPCAAIARRAAPTSPA